MKFKKCLDQSSPIFGRRVKVTASKRFQEMQNIVKNR